MKEASMRSEAGFSVRKVEDQLIAGIRFSGSYDDVPQKLMKLRSLCNSNINGAPMSLFFNGRNGVSDIEVAFPVTDVVNEKDVITHVFEGRHYLTLTHRQPHDVSIPKEDIDASWKKLSDYLQQFEINWETGPIREVYPNGLNSQGLADRLFSVVELQVPVLLPAWLERFSDGVRQHVSAHEAADICQGSEKLTLTSPGNEQSAWVKQALDKLAIALPETTHQNNIMVACAHRYPKDGIAQLREMYLQLGSVDALLKFMRNEVAEGRAYYAVPEKRDNLMYMAKVPWEGGRSKQPKNDVERRAYHCHCGLVRSAILNQQTIDPVFCNCGSGWLKQLWEGVLERDVEVTMLESVLNGFDRCYFSIDVGEA